jgi:hypothetical protein
MATKREYSSRQQEMTVVSEPSDGESDNKAGAQPLSARKGSSRRTRKTPSHAGDAAAQAGVAVPAPAQEAESPKTCEFVVTVDMNTWLPTKIETLNAVTGQRKALSTEEFSAVMSYCGYAPPANESIVSQSPETASMSAAEREYWRGYSDYLKALASYK